MNWRSPLADRLGTGPARARRNLVIAPAAPHFAIAIAAALWGALLTCGAWSREARAESFVHAGVEARLSLGHDSNLLDASDLEQASFESGDPGSFFVVDRMSDQFWEGELDVEWKAPRLLGRPSLLLGWERRQYLHNPIRSEDRLTLGVRARPAERTRLSLEAVFRPQSYVRHRFDRDAMPGDPQFRPEVHRRWDLELAARQALEQGTTVDVFLEGSRRRYRAPFEERDRESFGGGGSLSRTLGDKVGIRAGARYRATWTENEPWDPDDRSHREWRASSGIDVRGLPFLKRVSLDVELEWRRFTSADPDDQDHFGRDDRGGEAEIEIVRGLSGSLDWTSRASRRWRSSDFPETVFDEEGVFEETVFHSGVVWAWERP